MLGWIILFALMSLPGAAVALSGYPEPASVKALSAVFAVLLFASLLAQMLRERAR